jgi:hypothetical protein
MRQPRHVASAIAVGSTNLLRYTGRAGIDYRSCGGRQGIFSDFAAIGCCRSGGMDGSFFQVAGGVRRKWQWFIRIGDKLRHQTGGYGRSDKVF